MNEVKLSIIVLSYNTQDLLRNCLISLEKVKEELTFEVIVPDNGSIDGSVKMVKKEFPQFKVIKNKRNLGFAAGNNTARKYCQGKYILFLNSDTIVKKGVLKKTVRYMDKNPKVGALTCKLILPNGELDKDARRSFPTPWVSLTHLVLRLDKFFPTSPLFARYWYGYVSENKTHEVDVIQGAYFLSPKKLLDDLNWFDEEYFLDGEDIDICWRIWKKGKKIIYYPKVNILHLKGASKGKKQSKRKVALKSRLKFRMAGVNSMEIFYRKRLWDEYPYILNIFVLTGIKLLKLARLVKVILE